MTEPSAVSRFPARLSTAWQTLSCAHRTWFVCVLFVSLGFLVAIPPFQTNDEPAHWHRVWTIASGELTCGPIPSVVDVALGASEYKAIRFLRQPFRFASWDAMRKLRGVDATVTTAGGACAYIPVAYVLPALAMLPFVSPFDPKRDAGMLRAFYAARAASWALMGASVLLFLLFAPGFRNIALVVYSFPTVIQQTVAINQESLTFLCLFVLVLLWVQRPTLPRVLGMLVAITLLTAMKVTFLVLLLLWMATLVRWKRAESISTRRFIGMVALLLVPLVLHLWWWNSGAAGVSPSNFPGEVNPGAQLRYLFDNPGHFFRMMWRGHTDLLGRGHMNGGWTGVLGVLGWAEFEIGNGAYLLLTLAVILGWVLDVVNRDEVRTSEPDDRKERLVRWFIPMLSAYAIVPAIIFSMYVTFSQVAAGHAVGVQGRHLLFSYFLLLVLGADYYRHVSRSRWVNRFPSALLQWLPWGLLALCLWASSDAFAAILKAFHAIPP